jgi:RimJ/RimL family protein N-acetyltransferase
MSPPSAPVAETPRLRLRRFTEDDAAFIVELLNDPGWLRYLVRRATLPDADVGFAFLPAFRGRGYAAEATAAVLAEAATHGLARVVAIADPANAASIAVLQRAGLRYERRVQLDGDEAELALYAIDLAGARGEPPAPAAV